MARPYCAAAAWKSQIRGIARRKTDGNNEPASEHISIPKKKKAPGRDPGREVWNEGQ
ncbi:hypothetical protein PXK05_09845 [Phaeobacter gallaeciensis]|jgi:hypothetical protein|uniref:hypothetical protein n=1 Tax=Phaeobacter gallaeciensis TaxID=60890 RepID=UPI00237FD1BB|nr:hypothetical protein [Phaeobacter gallaeciensis]MDE4153355.1 hypothetical protein [Phaeobacter gallaeciensis]MDE4228744.1 hypothetical protein [Phaeobacter gallaeciensis]MDE4266245.1 hypothetical protein [Phaeobacter gallaeciensis]